MSDAIGLSTKGVLCSGEGDSQIFEVQELIGIVEVLDEITGIIDEC